MLTLNNNYLISDVSSKFTKFETCSIESGKSELYKQFMLHFSEFISFFSIIIKSKTCKTKKNLSGNHINGTYIILRLTKNNFYLLANV